MRKLSGKDGLRILFSSKTSKNLKKTEKSFKKGIDKREKKWYNMQAVVRTATEDHERFAERAV